MSQLSPATNKTPLLSDRTYTILKHIAAIGLPAFSTLYFALAQIWSFPDTQEVMGTIAALNMFLGAFVGVSTITYNKSDAKYVGTIEVADNGLKKTYSLNLNDTPESLETMQTATFKVTPVPPLQNPPTLGV